MCHEAKGEPDGGIEIDMSSSFCAKITPSGFLSAKGDFHHLSTVVPLTSNCQYFLDPKTTRYSLKGPWVL